MFDSNLSRVIIINFISALIIALVGCYFLKTINLNDVMHIANIFGLYFLVIYGIDILIASGDLKNNSQRFLLVIALILAFDGVFLIIVPLIFGNVFSVPDYLTLVFNGVRFDVTLNAFVYLAIFAVIMIIFNVLLYFKDKEKYSN